MTRDDVIRITEDVIRNLELEVEDGHWTEPNNRTVKLLFNGKAISSVTFSVVQKEEYEG